MRKFIVALLLTTGCLAEEPESVGEAQAGLGQVKANARVRNDPSLSIRNPSVAIVEKKSSVVIGGPISVPHVAAYDYNGEVNFSRAVAAGNNSNAFAWTHKVLGKDSAVPDEFERPFVLNQLNQYEPIKWGNNYYQWAKYSGTPTVLAFPRNQANSQTDAQSNTLAMVTAVDGVGQFGELRPSSNLAVLKSSDGGVIFRAPLLIESDPAQSTQTSHETRIVGPVVATQEFNSTGLSDFGFADNRIWVLWRNETTWRVRRVVVQGGTGENNPPTSFGGIGYDVDIPTSIMPLTAGTPAIAVAGRSQFGTEVFILFPTYDDTQTTCPSSATVTIDWKLTSMTVAGTGPSGVFSTPVSIRTSTGWKKCVGPSGPSGTPWTPNTSRPQLLIDPVSDSLYAALPVSGNSNRGQIEVRAKQRNDSAFTTIYTSPTSLVAGIPSAARDSWSPALSLFHYPTQTHAQLMLTYYSTLADATPGFPNPYNKYVGVVAAANILSGTGMWQTSILPNTTNQIVDDFLGTRNSCVAEPYVQGGFMCAWGDQRATTKTEIWANVMNEP